MTRAEVRKRLGLLWWRQLALTLAPVFVLNLLFGGSKTVSVLAMPLFIGGMASMFVTLPLFTLFKQSLIATEKALDTPEEPNAWLVLAARRRQGFLAASLPAWIAAIAVFTGLEAVPLHLLALASTVILMLYRIPRQLG